MSDSRQFRPMQKICQVADDIPPLSSIKLTPLQARDSKEPQCQCCHQGTWAICAWRSPGWAQSKMCDTLRWQGHWDMMFSTTYLDGAGVQIRKVAGKREESDQEWSGGSHCNCKTEEVMTAIRQRKQEGFDAPQAPLFGTNRGSYRPIFIVGSNASLGPDISRCPNRDNSSASHRLLGSQFRPH